MYNSLSINELRGAGQPRSRNSLILRELQGLTRGQKETPPPMEISRGRGSVGGFWGYAGSASAFLLFNLDSFDHGSVSCDLVKHRLHRHGALWQLGEVATLEVLSDAVVESPKGTTLKLIVARVAEFLHRFVNVTGGKRLGIYEVNHHVSATVADDFSVFVSFDALTHVRPVRHNPRDGTGENQWKVAHDVERVPTGELHIRREAKVFTNQHLIADAHRRGERLVVRVAKPKHQLTVT